MTARRAFAYVFAPLAAITLGCGDSDGSTGGGGQGAASSTVSTGTGDAKTSTSYSTTSSTGAGGAPDLDLSECDTNADCPGGECVDINAGYRACQYPVTEATACTGSQFDACCDSTECMNGEACFAAPLVPFCGGVQMKPHNECGADLCTTNADCPDGVCVPAGVVGNQVAMCIPAMCFGTVCGQESLSSCALVREPCCGGPAGFYCIEPDGCQTNADCTDGWCNLGVCEPGGPLCPA